MKKADGHCSPVLSGSGVTEETMEDAVGWAPTGGLGGPSMAKKCGGAQLGRLGL